jgi:hypothetical protein
LLWCHKLSPFCPATVQLISHYYKNCHVRSDDSGPNFCLKVIILCSQLVPLGCVYLHVTDITWYCLTHYSHQHSIFCYFPWTVHPKFQNPAIGLWLHQETVLALGCKLTWISIENEFCRKYSYKGQILNIPLCILSLLAGVIFRAIQFTTFFLLLYLLHSP